MTTQRTKPTKRPSTALVRRQPPKVRAVFPARRPSNTQLTLEENLRRFEALTSATAALVRRPPPPVTLPTLDDSIQLGEFGLVEIQFTAKEEAALAAPLDLSEIRVKPTGQIYLCLHPCTRVLTTALEWMPLRDIKIDDELVSVDEHKPNHGQRRKMRPARVTAMATTVQPQFLVTFEGGRQVICSSEHRWLSRKSQNLWDWRPLRRLRAGDRIVDLGAPWQRDESRDAGWLAGVFDGEAALVDVRSPRPGAHPDRDGTRGRFGVYFTQNPGHVLNETMRLLEHFGYYFRPPVPRCDEAGCQAVVVSGLYNSLRFLGSIRPGRLLQRSAVLWTNKTFMGSDLIIETIAELGDGEMIDLTTTEGTFLAEGLVSHNSHITYTRWLNRAFGRTGWALRPASKPLLNANAVVVPYLLLVHQKPVAFALGEQEYFADNRDQSYGDALEATVASGLRRCCKHLGLALELWDHGFAEAFLSDHCVRVKTEGKDGHLKTAWRRQIDSPLWNEVQTGRRPVDAEAPRPPAPSVSPVAQHAQADTPISDGQRRRLWTIVGTRGRSDPEVKRYLLGLGYASSKDIRRSAYDSIVAAIEHPGPLPFVERVPGQEG